MASDRIKVMRKPRRHTGRGFTLMEVTLALIVFLMMTLMFAAAFPMALRAAKFSNNYTQAAQIGQHKIDQMRAAGVNNLTYAGLSNQGIIDASPMTSPYSFTTVDALANNGTNHGYFPTGSTGTITVQDYHDFQAASGVTPTVPEGVMDYVTVTITWTGGGVSTGNYHVSAIIIKMRHS